VDDVGDVDADAVMVVVTVGMGAGVDVGTGVSVGAGTRSGDTAGVSKGITNLWPMMIMSASLNPLTALISAAFRS
jgi:hypothetical protein